MPRNLTANYFCAVTSMISLPLLQQSIRTRSTEPGTEVYDPVRKGWFIMTPEEHVRQRLLGYLMDGLRYPARLISVEKELRIGNVRRRFDIVVYNRDYRPWMLLECKAPDVPVTDGTLQQLLAYHSQIPCRYWVLSNGIATFCADAGAGSPVWLTSLPVYDF